MKNPSIWDLLALLFKFVDEAGCAKQVFDLT
jgi:hypothetical protein